MNEPISLDEALRLAAWLEANAKHMQYEDEQVQMIKAARMLRFLDKEVNNNIESLNKAHDMLREIKGFVHELSQQALTRDCPGIPMSVLRG